MSEEAIQIVQMSGRIIPFDRSNIARAKATSTGLELPEDLPLDEWAAIGDAISNAEQSVMWWIGDWWAYGQAQGYGERSKILDRLASEGHNPPPFRVCHNASTLVRQFPSARRRALLSVEHHRAVLGLEAEEQDWMLDRSQAHGWTRAELRDEVRRFKLERLRRPGDRKYETQTIQDLTLLVEQEKQFGTIYADPPWPYGNQATRAATKNHYKAHNDLSIEDICNLPIAKLTADSAHCHLWTTNGFLREAFDVMAAWGFIYKSCFIWVKPDFGIGNYWRVGHEFMLFGIKGKAPFGDNAQQSWIYEQAGEHSTKPAKVRQIIERTSPGPFLELFGRRLVENWTVWGNEIERPLDSGTLFNKASQ